MSELLFLSQVFRALCAHTCSAVLPREVAGKGYFYQDVNIFPTAPASWYPGDDWLDYYGGDCTADNDWAAYSFLKKHVLKAADFPALTSDAAYESYGSCYNISAGDMQGDAADVGINWRNSTHNPRNQHHFDTIEGGCGCSRLAFFSSVAGLSVIFRPGPMDCGQWRLEGGRRRTKQYITEVWC